MPQIDAFTVQRHAADASFGKPLIQNNLRAMVVEAMIDLALPAEWRWCSIDWAACDFRKIGGHNTQFYVPLSLFNVSQ